MAATVGRGRPDPGKDGRPQSCGQGGLAHPAPDDGRPARPCGPQLLEAIQAELAQGRRLNLRDAGILLGIMLDKAELLAAQTGGSDGRSMSREDIMARLRDMAADMRQRKEAAGDG
jgi:hypothetical protein